LLRTPDTASGAPDIGFDTPDINGAAQGPVITDTEISLDLFVGFLRCGGALSLEEWMASPEAIRALLVEAANTLQSERLGTAGYATLSDRHAAEVLGRSDGGALYRRLSLTEAAVGALSSLRRRA